MSSRRSPADTDRMISLKVDNLTYRTRKEDLKRSFEKYGDIGDVYIPRDPYSKDSLGYAFVRFYDRRDAIDALDAMDGALVDGRPIRVQLARYGRFKGFRGGRGRYRSNSPYRRQYRRSRSRQYSPANNHSSRRYNTSRQHRNSPANHRRYNGHDDEYYRNRKESRRESIEHSHRHRQESTRETSRSTERKNRSRTGSESHYNRGSSAVSTRSSSSKHSVTQRQSSIDKDVASDFSTSPKAKQRSPSFQREVEHSRSRSSSLKSSITVHSTN